MANPVRFKRDSVNPIAHGNPEHLELMAARSRARLLRLAGLAYHDRTLAEQRYAAAICSKTAKTSSSCVLGVTFGMTCATTPGRPAARAHARPGRQPRDTELPVEQISTLNKKLYETEPRIQQTSLRCQRPEAK